MHKYVIRRLLLSVPVLLLSSLIVFGLMRVMPGDALTALMGESGNVGAKELQKLRMDLGLDRPYHEQYAIWLWQMVSLNPGFSIFTNEPISVALKKAVPVTLELATLAIILGLSIAIPVGVLSATRQDTISDYAGRVVAVSGLSMPEFWIGTLVITFAAIWFHWIPPIGYVSLWDSPWKNLQQFLVPAAILGFRLSAATMRMTRSTVLEVLREDYVRTAWAKGLAGKIVVYKHALKHALIPVVTIVGGQLGTLLAGTVVVETISWSRRRGWRSSRAWPSAWPCSASTSSATPCETPGTPGCAKAEPRRWPCSSAVPSAPGAAVPGSTRSS